MKRNYIAWLILSAAVMLLLPAAAVAFVKSDAGMAVSILLFFAIDPIYSLIVGIFAGKDIKKMWSLPVISSVTFLLGAWLFFDMGEIAFIMYAGIYLAIGIIAMLLSGFVRKRAKIQYHQS
ncbi:MAG: hypothetical protein J1F64_11045 [Oscillospiraceae bacterium]|nr:hypothetical protein [Oscillospiraceae bacterium]